MKPSIIQSPTNDLQGPEAFAAYQVRVAAAKKEEHATYVNTILVDEGREERIRRMMKEVDENFFRERAAEAAAATTGGDKKDEDVEEWVLV